MSKVIQTHWRQQSRAETGPPYSLPVVGRLFGLHCRKIIVHGVWEFSLSPDNEPKAPASPVVTEQQSPNQRWTPLSKDLTRASPACICLHSPLSYRKHTFHSPLVIQAFLPPHSLVPGRKPPPEHSDPESIQV